MLNIFKKIMTISFSFCALASQSIVNVLANEIQAKEYFNDTVFTSSHSELPNSHGFYRNWPYSGVGCIVSDENHVYFVSNQISYYYGNTHNRCYRSRRQVSILKKNKLTGATVQQLNLNQLSAETVSCGIHENYLYFIGSNTNDCPSNYYIESHIVRITLNNFAYKDKKLLRTFANTPEFKYDKIDTDVVQNTAQKKYVNYPKDSVNIYGNLYIAFFHEYSGIWVVDIASNTMTIKKSFQPTYVQEGSYINETTNEEVKTYETININYYKKLLVHKNNLYIISDNMKDSSKLLKYNITNTSSQYDTVLDSIKDLPDVISVRDVEVNPITEKFYILSGLVSSEIRQYDSEFDQIKADGCGSDFIKIPNDLGLIEQFTIDYNTGFLYFFISNMYYYNGVGTIRLIDFSLMDTIYKFNVGYGMYANQYGPVSTNNYMIHYNNISYFDNENGRLIISTYGYYYRKIIILDLIGCSKGLGVVNSKPYCVICQNGKFNDEIGNVCKKCDYGYSTQSSGAFECEECSVGLYANVIGSVSCFECQTGKYSDITGATSCKLCEKGKYSTTVAATTIEKCKVCASGTMSDIGSESCIECVAGKYEKNNKECSNCPKGRYNELNEQSAVHSCKLCSKGKFNTIEGGNSESFCINCPLGKMGIEDGAISNITCIDCMPGQYRDHTMLECAPCSEGRVSQQSSNSCESCQAGYYSYNYEKCLSCQAGKFSENEKNDCNTCPDGYISQKNSENCDQCDIGKFANEKRKCIDCPSGTYSEVENIISINSCIECNAGKWSNITGSDNIDNCIECKPGKYNKNTGKSSEEDCIICEAGKYSESEYGSTSCLVCPDGYVSQQMVHECEECMLGQYAYEKRECNKCSKGKFSDVEHILTEDECKLCSKGKWNDEIGSQDINKCRNCEEGKFGNKMGQRSKNECMKCIAGKYSNAMFGSTTCIDCPDGFVSLAQSYECDQCELGKYANNKLECLNCPQGKYGDDINILLETDCKLCPKGKWNDEVGTTQINNCMDCTEGKYGNKLGQRLESECTECVAGKYSEKMFASTKCLDCPDGFISEDISHECDQCDLGKFANKRLECLDCPKGTFGDTLNILTVQDCKLCPKGKWNNETGSSIINDCIDCSPGKFSNKLGQTSNDCIECNIGQYSNRMDGSTECLDCPNGYISAQGSFECYKCELGKFANKRLECTNCPKGKYSDIDDIVLESQCKNCNKGKWSDTVGAENEDTCIVCETGKYGNVYGQISPKACINCVEGKYRDILTDPGVDCIVCENGKYSSIGSYKCENCPAGKYNNGDRAEDHMECILCVSGKYNEIEGADSVEKCKNCGAGKYSIVMGLTVESGCKLCRAGRYNEEEGSNTVLACKVCASGKYRATPGATSEQECIDCSPGKFSNNDDGADSCIECGIGKFTNIQGSRVCFKCEEGRYSDVINTLSCKSCPDNSLQNIDADSCFCKKGSYVADFNDIGEPICEGCQDSMICKENTDMENIITRRGYWRHKKDTLIVKKCRVGYACIEGKIKNSSDELCNVGHKGPLCDVCIKGWAKNGGKCFDCSKTEKSRSIFFTAAVPLICVFILVFMIRTANPTSETKEPLSGVVKIFMNYAQVFSLASSFEINWPQIIIDLFETTKEFSSPRVSFYSSDCTIGWSYYDKFLVYISLPMFFVFCTMIILVCVTYKYNSNRNKILEGTKEIPTHYKDIIEYRKKNPEPLIFYKSWFYTSTVIGTFLAWPTVIKQTLTIINCVEIGDGYYLSSDLGISCYDKQHKIFLYIGYASLIFYGFLVPAFGFSLVGRYRFNLYEQNSKYEGALPLSFLFLGYREKMWFYELLVMGKKFGLILISVFLKEIPRYQMITASLLIQFTFFLHIFLRPYDDITAYGILCNRLETISLLALVVTLNSGLFFGTIDANHDLGSFEIVLIVLLFAMNFIVVSYFGYYMIMLGVKIMKQKFKHLVQVILCKNLKELEHLEVITLDNVEFRPFLLKILRPEFLSEVYEWTTTSEVNDHGIVLKNQYEIDLFDNYFKGKKIFSSTIRNKLVHLEMNKRRNSIEGSYFGNDYINLSLNRLRNKIEIIEKKRCWYSILNNRLFFDLRKQIMVSKRLVGAKDREHINEIFNEYVKNGIEYNDKMRELSCRALEGLRTVGQKPEKRFSQEEPDIESMTVNKMFKKNQMPQESGNIKIIINNMKEINKFNKKEKTEFEKTIQMNRVSKDISYSSDDEMVI